MTKTINIQLLQLFDEYKSRGFQILAFPCNQFGGQELGTHEEIKTFFTTKLCFLFGYGSRMMSQSERIIFDVRGLLLVPALLTGLGLYF